MTSYWFCHADTHFPDGNSAIYVTPVFPVISSRASLNAETDDFNGYRSSLLSWALPKFKLDQQFTTAYCSSSEKRAESEEAHTQRLKAWQSPYPGQPVLKIIPVDFIPVAKDLKPEEIPAVAGAWKCSVELVSSDPPPGVDRTRSFPLLIGLFVPEHAVVQGGDPSFNYRVRIGAAGSAAETLGNHGLQMLLQQTCADSQFKWKEDGSIYVVPEQLHGSCDVATFSTHFNGESLSGTLDIHAGKTLASGNIRCTRN